jgi:hypothetical protein
MDAHPLPPDDVNDLERRLGTWRPAGDGLSPDAMLFAAGRASAHTGRVIWPATTGCLTAVVVGLGVWLTVERSERLALARQLREQAPASAPAPALAPEEPPTAETPAPDAYLLLRRDWEHDPQTWADRPRLPEAGQHGSPTPNPPPLRAWQPGGPREPL